MEVDFEKERDWERVESNKKVFRAACESASTCERALRAACLLFLGVMDAISHPHSPKG
jgi:hypothetical protein